MRPSLLRRLTGVALAAAALAAVAPTAGAQLRAGFRSTLVARGDDTVSPFAAWGFSGNFRGGTYNSASACMNGFVVVAPFQFDPSACVYQGQSGAPTTLPGFGDVYGTAVVAAFRDLNSSPAASGQLGYGSGTVDGRTAFGYTWDGVFTFNTTTPNFLQILFIERYDRGVGDFDIEYNYGALAAAGGIGGVADDGGFTGAAYSVAVTPTANSRFVQCVVGGSVNNNACAPVQGVVPEPSTYALTLAGLGALAAAARRRRAA